MRRESRRPPLSLSLSLPSPFPLRRAAALVFQQSPGIGRVPVKRYQVAHGQCLPDREKARRAAARLSGTAAPRRGAAFSDDNEASCV